MTCLISQLGSVSKPFLFPGSCGGKRDCLGRFGEHVRHVRLHADPAPSACWVLAFFPGTITAILIKMPGLPRNAVIFLPWCYSLPERPRHSQAVPAGSVSAQEKHDRQSNLAGVCWSPAHGACTSGGGAGWVGAWVAAFIWVRVQ